MEKVKTSANEIRELHADKEWAALSDLFSEIHGFHISPSQLKLRSLAAHPGKKTLFLSAWEGAQMKGACAFIPYLFHSENNDLCGYQMAWAGVLPEYRRQGVFTQLESSGKEKIFSNGGDFIFSFSDSEKISAAVLSGIPGYRKIPVQKTVILSDSNLREGDAMNHVLLNSETEPDFFLLMERCRRQAGKFFREFESGPNRMFGYQVNETFFCGEIRVFSFQGLKELLSRMFQATGAHLFRFSASGNHPALKAVKFPGLDVFNMEISVNPSAAELDEARLRISAGLRDTFGWA